MGDKVISKIEKKRIDVLFDVKTVKHNPRNTGGRNHKGIYSLPVAVKKCRNCTSYAINHGKLCLKCYESLSVCAKCNKLLNKDSFYNNYRRRFGIESNCKECCRAAYRNRTEEQRLTKITKKYKMTVHSFRNLLIEQRGLCAICSKHFGKKLCIDHDHKTGVIRGLLCRKCNMALGYLDDDIKSVLGAAKYLKKFYE